MRIDTRMIHNQLSHHVAFAANVYKVMIKNTGDILFPSFTWNSCIPNERKFIISIFVMEKKNYTTN